MRRHTLMIGALLLAGCVDMTQPADVAIADELCSKRGGYSHVYRWERGKQLDVNCKDGTQITVRPAAPTAQQEPMP